jgi:transcription elongation factor Elf1
VKLHGKTTKTESKTATAEAYSGRVPMSRLWKYSCGLEMTVDDVNPLTEPVDIYGSFIDRFYETRKAEA